MKKSHNMDADKKICPYCGEEIMAAAKKCCHCGKWLNDDNSALSVNKSSSTTSPNIESKNAKFPLSSVFVKIIAIIGAIAIVVAIYYFSRNNDDRKESTGQDTTVEEVIIEPDESEYVIE